jgi:DNA-binding NtrC family response regulator
MQQSAADHILIVEDDQFTVVLISMLLQRQGYRVSVCRDGSEAIEFLQKEVPSLMLLDIMMPQVSGYKTLAWVRSHPRLHNLPVICVSILDDRQALNRIFDSGATDYIGKPIRENELLARIRVHLKLRSQDREITEALAEVSKLGQRLLTRKLEHPEAFQKIITRHPRMLAIFHYIEAVAPSARPVLVTGDTGVGKELVAQAIHDVSGRTGRFVVVNVGGLDDTLFSDTLFGHEKGAFTGALKDRRGLVRDADQGTLFLDEIGELSASSQVKLLRLLQEREYYPLGSDVRCLSTARVICATHADLEAKVVKGEYRSDLYYRLNTHHLQVPALCQRRSDIPLLLHHFVTQAAATLKIPPPEIPAELETALCQYPFPGNIRELEALCHDLVSRSTVAPISASSFLESLAPAGTATMPTENPALEETDPGFLLDGGVLPTIREVVDRLVQTALDRAGGNQALAARYLGISRQALHKRLKKKAQGVTDDDV